MLQTDESIKNVIVIIQIYMALYRISSQKYGFQPKSVHIIGFSNRTTLSKLFIITGSMPLDINMSKIYNEPPTFPK